MQLGQFDTVSRLQERGLAKIKALKLDYDLLLTCKEVEKFNDSLFSLKSK